MTQPSRSPVLQAGKRLFAAALVALTAVFIYCYANPWQSASPFRSGDSEVVVPLSAAPAQSVHFQVYQAVEDFPVVLRVAKPPRVRLMGLISPFGSGFEQDLLARFAEDYGFTVQNREVAGFAEAHALLKAGKVDLIIGFSGDEAVANDENLASSPGYRQNHAVLLSTRRNTADRGLVVSDPGLVGALPEQGKQTKQNGRDAPQPRAVQPNVHDIFAGLDNGAVGTALLDATSSALLRPFFLDVKAKAKNLSAKTEHRWYWNRNGALPDLALTSFWQDKDTAALLTKLEERYFGFLPKGVNAPILESLMATLGDELQRYHETIAKAAQQYSLDPLLLTAVIFQESRFDANAVSPTGAKGLLQFTNATAQAMGVNRADPVSSIYGGARYLRKLWNALDGHDLAFWDRWFLALAAYNQGPAHLKDAMALAERIKGDGGSWGNVKSVFPLLASGEYAARAKYGACRGREAVNFVENVRYYYYVLNGLVVLDRPEAEHLAPLLAVNAGGSGRAGSGL